MNLGAKLQKASADRVHTTNPILLFSRSMLARENTLLETGGSDIFRVFAPPMAKVGFC